MGQHHEVNLNPFYVWSAQKILSSLAADDFAPRTVQLSEPINIHILYWTARADDDGLIRFQPDIYNRDTVLDAALRVSPPQPAK